MDERDTTRGEFMVSGGRADQPSISPADSPWFRADLDGLRAVAILVVVAFHARITGFGGGFVGVDVFFVISGFLITTNLLREADESSRVRLLAFWARRIRRLVPALALMVVATMIGSVVILSNFEIERIADEGLAAALYVSNLRFASETQGYFARDVSESPLLHTWSLGVEEQFYLVWPVVVGLAVWLVRRRPDSLRAVLRWLFVAVAAASFLHNLALTDDVSTWAFYGLPTRAWEFAVAGLLATVSAPAFLGRRAWRFGLAGVGLGLIAIATVQLSDSTAYPGRAALLPVVGTLLVLVAGDIARPDDGRPTILARGLSSAPMQWIGRLSYSWYLWHWPVLVLTIAATEQDTVVVRVAAVSAALPIAWVAYRFFENPIRLHWRAIRPVGRTMALGAGLTAVAVGASVGAGAFAEARPRVSVEVQLEEVRDGFLPLCFVKDTTAAGFEYCVGGMADGDGAVVLVGDSKASTWFNVVSASMFDAGGRLALVTSAGCPFMDIDVQVEGDQPFDRDGCRDRRRIAHDVIEEFDADYVLIAQGNLYLDIGEVDVEGPDRSEQAQVESWAQAFERMVVDLRNAGREPIVILDNPALPEDPAICIARNAAVEPCELPTAEAMAVIAPLRAVELEIVERLDVLHIDPSTALCDEVCHLGYEDHLVYVDSNHLAYRAVERFRPELDALFASLSRGE